MFSSSTNTTTTNNNNNNNNITTILNSMSLFPQYYFPSSSSSSSPHLSNNNNNNNNNNNHYHHQLSQITTPSTLPNHDDLSLFHQNTQHDPSFIFSNNNINIPEITQMINFGASSTNIIGGTRSSTIVGISNHLAPSSTINDHNLLAVVNPKKKSPAAKKDRHSKIFTAQGLRDRRVRLSVEIAREFFDLHDTLGFDKASKTLEWLLRKSDKAIHELSRGRSKSFSSATNCNYSESTDQVVSEVNDAAFDQALTAEPPWSKASAAKESRARARARARARTKEKNPNSFNNKKIEKCGSSSQISSQLLVNPNYSNEVIAHDRDQSGVVTIKRSCCHHHQKLINVPDWISSSRTSDQYQRQGFRTVYVGETSNDNVLFPQHWDVNSTVSPTRSSFSLRT